MSNKYYKIKKLYGLLLSCFAISLISCQTPPSIPRNPLKYINLKFHAQDNINKGALLAIDVIATENDNEILAIGPEEWFLNKKRSELVLDDELYIITIKSGETIPVTVRRKTNVKRIVIFAEYGNTSDRLDKQLVLEPGYMNFSYEIVLLGNKIMLKNDYKQPVSTQSI